MDATLPLYMAKAVNALKAHHTAGGHRNYASDVLLYEWVHGKKLPSQVLAHMPKCTGCGVAKIVDKSAQQTRLLPAKRPGEVISGDLIVDLPKSPTGYRHALHMHDVCSNFGGMVLLKTRSASVHFLAWLKWLANTVRRSAVKVLIDGGELHTTALRDYVREVGGVIVVNLANVHSNMTIERRNRTIEELPTAMLKHGGAPASFWEFTFPQANMIENMLPNRERLKKTGTPSPNKVRPLTPFEMVVNDMNKCNMEVLFKALIPMFSHVIGYVQSEDPTRAAHDPRGFEGIYCGRINDAGPTVVQHGHLVLRFSDRRVVRVRTVDSDPTRFPLLSSLPREPAITLSGGEKEDEKSSEVLESVSPDTLGDVDLPNVLPGKIGGRVIGLDKYAVGTEVRTSAGPAIVVGRYGDGDYKVRYPEFNEPQAIWCVGPNEIICQTDEAKWAFPGEVSEKTDRLHDEKVTVSDPVIVTPKGLPVEPVTNIRPTRGGGYNLRRRANIARTRRELGASRLWDSGNEHVRDEYPYWLSRPPKTANVSKNRVPTPVTYPATRAEIFSRPAREIEAALPRHRHQTLHHPFRPFIAEAEEVELQDCCNRGVFGELVDPPRGAIIIGLMWVYAVKAHDDPEALLRKFRSRITLMGNQERNILDKLEAYAPVHMAITLRVLIALHMGNPKVRWRKLDIKNAYINEDMKRLVLVHHPPGYCMYVDSNGDIMYRALRPGEMAPKTALTLRKALYGGMECGRIFWEAFVDWHLAYGFQLIHEDRCYLHYWKSADEWIKFPFHVDDNAIATSGEELYAQYLKDLQTKFDVEEGPMTSHLGVNYHFDYESGTVHIEQSAQTKKVLMDFGMSECNSSGAKAPALQGVPPCQDDCIEPGVDWDGKDFDMEKLVGHLQYLYMCTRPDIGYVLKILSRFTKSFGPKHVQFAKHVLRYLRGTLTLGLNYTRGFPLYPQIFPDASHVKDTDPRKSILSVVVKVGGNTVYWKNHFSKIVSHSSTESELMALDKGATVSEMVGWLIESLGGPAQEIIEIFVDNNGTISIACNPVQQGRNVHVHARYYYVRDLVYGGSVRVDHLDTELQIADVGCSFKGSPNFLALRGYLMGCSRVVLNEHKEYEWETREDDPL